MLGDKDREGVSYKLETSSLMAWERQMKLGFAHLLLLTVVALSFYTGYITGFAKALSVASETLRDLHALVLETEKPVQKGRRR